MTTVSTIDLSTTGPEPAAAILSPAEAGVAVRSLTAADKIALMKIARLYAIESEVKDPLDEWLSPKTEGRFFAFSKPRPDRMLSSWFLAAATL